MTKRFDYYRFYGSDLKTLIHEDSRRYYLLKEEADHQRRFMPRVKRSVPLCMILGLLVLKKPLLALKDDEPYDLVADNGVVRITGQSSYLALGDLAQMQKDRVH